MSSINHTFIYFHIGICAAVMFLVKPYILYLILKNITKHCSTFATRGTTCTLSKALKQSSHANSSNSLLFSEQSSRKVRDSMFEHIFIHVNVGTTFHQQQLFPQCLNCCLLFSRRKTKSNTTRVFHALKKKRKIKNSSVSC